MIIGLQKIEKSYGYLHKPADFEKEHLLYLHGMGYSINDPEFYYNRKSFPDFVVMYCICGKIHINQYGASATVLPGECCLMDLRDEHLYYSDADEPCSLA